MATVQRRIALANPAVNLDDLLFMDMGSSNLIQGYPLQNNRGYGGIYRVNGLRNDEPALVDVLADRPLADGLAAGQTLSNTNPRWRRQMTFSGMDLSFDGRELVFSASGAATGIRGRDQVGASLVVYRQTQFQWNERRAERPDPLEALNEVPGWTKLHWGVHHLYRLRLDQKTVHTVRRDPIYHSVMPAWLPDGRIVFCSDIMHGLERCGGARPAVTLCRIQTDGQGFTPLSFHEINEWQPSIDNDGMLIFSRRDYVDRALPFHHFWRAYPDGRDPRGPIGNYQKFPGADGVRMPESMISIQALPGQAGRYLAVASGHHSRFVGGLDCR